VFDIPYTVGCNAHPDDVFLGVAVQFDSNGYVQGYKFRFGLPFTGYSTGHVQITYHLREPCTQIVQVATPTENAAWVARTASMSNYEVPTLLYRYAQDFAPFGGVRQPDGQPGDWTAYPGPGPLYVERRGQDLANAASPYSCQQSGGCAGRICSNNPNNLCRSKAELDSCTSGNGYCIGLGTGFCSNDVTRFCSGPADCANNAACLTTGAGAANITLADAIERLKRLFADVYTGWEWSLSQGTHTYVNNQAMQNIISPWQQIFDNMPLCPNNTRPAYPGDYCGIQPSASNCSVGSGGGQPGQSLRVSAGQTFQMTFNVVADPNQLPIKNIDIVWSGTDSTFLQGPFANGPVTVSHLYTQPGVYRPVIQVKDNWDFCSNQNATSKADSCADETSGDWLPTNIPITVSQ
jgi:hypothetical protein